MFYVEPDETHSSEPTEKDVACVQRLMDRIERLPTIRSSLPSIKQSLKETLENDLMRGQAAPGLAELVNNNRRRGERATIEVQMIRMAIAAMKERHTRSGSQQAALKEELEAMLEQSSADTWARIGRVMDHANRRG